MDLNQPHKQIPTAAMIVAACIDLTQKIGGVYRVLYSFVKACTAKGALPRAS
ncbi:MAG: hypothetical protein SWH54_20105 [Thermodesulfobacteriota bacterium]|nr:hypothetical protein [Thermodesulfobacteriota bacterium]